LLATRIDAEPIPSFTNKTRERLDACLEQIKFPYYGGLISRAANVFYLINKNHPLENGNKRMAVAVLYVFLALNGYRLTIKQNAMVKLAKWVVGTGSESKEAVVNGLEIIIENSLIDLPPDF
jgi:death-on-curing family protein